MSPSEQKNIAEQFCKENLLECCMEILSMVETGILIDGKVRELARINQQYSGYNGLAMAEAQIKVEAMRAFVASKFVPEVSQPE
jgi:hypothetical protein